MASREQLEQAITVQESLRGTVDDSIIDATIATLREKIAALAAKGYEQQRKLVTVLFADVSGFTAMSENMDAEDLNDIMNALWERLDKAITDFGGYIDKHIGDAVMALWGAEVAQENDPEQAIRGALAMQNEIADFRLKIGDLGVAQSSIQNLQSKISLRIGINTGPVLLGEVGTIGEFTAMGDTVNTASRLEHAAPVDGILISHDTYRHVRGVFDVETPNPIAIRGKSELLQVYVVRRAKPRAFRRNTRGVEGVETRMIGRDAELKRLQHAFLSVLEGGELQMVTVVGDAGVGKSRLLYEFENWLDVEPETIRLFKGRAGLDMQNLPYGLLRDNFMFRFQILEDDSASTVRKKMEQGIADGLRADARAEMKAHFIGQLLGFDFKASPHLQNLLEDAQQLHDRALIYLGEYFKSIASEVPIVCLFEDIHWADDSSLDMFTHLARTLREHRILIVALSRPTLYERRPHWGEGQSFHNRLNLHPLSKRDSRCLTEEILQMVKQIPEALRDVIVENAEGNPFYVEELIKMLIEDGVIVKSETEWEIIAEYLNEVSVPATLMEVLQARIESLSPDERTLLQQASVVGRIFWDTAVQYIHNNGEGKINLEDFPQKLMALHRREMVFKRETSAFSEAQEHIFKHALLRDVTYESVLKRIRRRYHALASQWLIAQSGERIIEYTGLIADHLELAGQTEEAMIYLKRAGDEAAQKYANQEALAYFTRALALVPEMDLETRWTLHNARGKIYELLGKLKLQATELATMEQLSASMGSVYRVETTLQQALYRRLVGDYLGARDNAKRALVLARKIGDRQREGRALQRLGVGFSQLGEIQQALAYYEQALALAKEFGNQFLESEAMGSMGILYRHLGKIHKALEYHEKQYLASQNELGNQRGKGIGLFGLGVCHAYLGNYKQALVYYKEGLAIVHELGYQRLEGFILTRFCEALAHLEQFEKATEYGQQAIGIREKQGITHLAIESRASLAHVQFAQAKYQDASDQVNIILNFLDGGNSLEGTDAPFQIYLTCYQVLHAVQSPRAQEILVTAYRKLQEQLAKIPEEFQRSFLENIPWHQEIITLWKAQHPTS